MSTQPDSCGRVHGAVTAITRHIRHNDLGQGDKLPSEAHFSRELGVSRPVVREAFRSLAAMRLIELHAGKRAIVAGLDYSSLSPVIEHGVHIEQITIQQIYDVRRTIEVRIASLAALRRTDEEAETIVLLARRMADCIEQPDQLMEHDLAMHSTIAKAAKNPVFSLIVGAFDGVTRQTWPIGWRSRTNHEEQQDMLDIHARLAQAIEAGNPEQAMIEMANHFDVSVQTLIKAGIA